ncbi:hypothetical protein X757_22970 [Mesorhizobium sp. LSHC414A00]|nr:hypothetical protein X757_22970 [Mesorhizobium sp. LSHC414A00]
MSRRSASCRSATASPWAARWRPWPAGASSTSTRSFPAISAPSGSSTRRRRSSWPASKGQVST